MHRYGVQNLLTYLNTAFILPVEAGNCTQQCGLAAATRAKQCIERSSRYIKRDILQRNYVTVAFPDVPDENLSH
jgi:endonuclease YncB( thermonuclease family)